MKGSPSTTSPEGLGSGQVSLSIATLASIRDSDLRIRAWTGANVEMMLVASTTLFTVDSELT